MFVNDQLEGIIVLVYVVAAVLYISYFLDFLYTNKDCIRE